MKRPRRLNAVNRTAQTEFYCGTCPIDPDIWPARLPLVIEVEVATGSWRIADVHLNVELPGLRRALRRIFAGNPMAHVNCCGLHALQRAYHAPYRRMIEIALVLAVKGFKEARPSEYLSEALKPSSWNNSEPDPRPRNDRSINGRTRPSGQPLQLSSARSPSRAAVRHTIGT